jgi:hypothetical protein
MVSSSIPKLSLYHNVRDNAFITLSAIQIYENRQIMSPQGMGVGWKISQQRDG